MSFLRKIKYPRLIILLLIFILTYILFSGTSFDFLHDITVSLGYFGAFFAGILFVYGFTSPIATAILLVLASSLNIFLAGFLAGIGAVLGDLIIFKFIHHNFQEEVDLLRQEHIYLKFKEFIPEYIRHHKFVKYLMLGFAGLIIASPLPDELGITILAMSRNISEFSFVLISYVLNTFGIFVILGIGLIL